MVVDTPRRDLCSMSAVLANEVDSTVSPRAESEVAATKPSAPNVPTSPTFKLARREPRGRIAQRVGKFGDVATVWEHDVRPF